MTKPQRVQETLLAFHSLPQRGHFILPPLSTQATLLGVRGCPPKISPFFNKYIEEHVRAQDMVVENIASCQYFLPIYTTRHQSTAATTLLATRASELIQSD